jgi:hypothetical protein
MDDSNEAKGAEWFCREIDRRVLEQLIEIARQMHLRKVICGKPTGKKFGIRKYRKFENRRRT